MKTEEMLMLKEQLEKEKGLTIHQLCTPIWLQMRNYSRSLVNNGHLTEEQWKEALSGGTLSEGSLAHLHFCNECSGLLNYNPFTNDLEEEDYEIISLDVFREEWYDLNYVFFPVRGTKWSPSVVSPYSNLPPGTTDILVKNAKEWYGE